MGRPHEYIRGVIMKMLAAFATLAFSLPATAGEIILGPVAAVVTEIIDGDTLRVEAIPWPGLVMRVSVRIRGIDTPEKRGKCESEKAAALAARDRLSELTPPGAAVHLIDVAPDKYAGRVDARILAGGADVGELLIGEGHARPYGGGARQGWCTMTP